jgi:hypothetical protein
VTIKATVTEGWRKLATSSAICTLHDVMLKNQVKDEEWTERERYGGNKKRIKKFSRKI